MMSGLEILHSGMCSKRAVGKSGVLGRANWKKRFLVLDFCNLTYYDKWWDTKSGDTGGAVEKGQFKVSNIRAIEKVDRDGFGKDEVFQVLYVDVDCQGPLGEDVIRVLYCEAEGAIINGVSPSQEWITKIRAAVRKVGDVTVLLDKYCPGAAPEGKYSCCQRQKDEVNFALAQGCTDTTKMGSQVFMQRSGSEPPSLPSSPPPTSEDSNPAKRPPAPAPGGTGSIRGKRPSLPLPPPSDTPPPLPSRPGSETRSPPGGGRGSSVKSQHGIRSGSSFKPSPAKGNALSSLEAEPWFAKGWTSTQTSTKLMAMEEGDFYVRESASKLGAYTVDIKTASTTEPIVAKRIYRTEDGFFRFEGDSVTYVSMRHCLRNCSDFKINMPAPPRPTQRQPSVRPGVRSDGSVKHGGIRGGGSMRNVKWETPGSRSQPALGPRRSINQGSNQSSAPMVNTRTLATDDDIYGEVDSFGDYEDADLEKTSDNAGTETLRIRELKAITQDHAPSTDSGGDGGALRAKNKLWKQRPDVTDAMLAKMDKKAIKRQEAIYELVYSEEAYLRDVEGLINVYLEGIYKKNLLDGKCMERFLKKARDVQSAGNALLRDLQARQTMSIVVDTISDVLEKHVESVATALYDYCEIALELRAMTGDCAPELASFLVSTMNSSESRGLSIDAYVLCPVQRMVRYPMLISEVEKVTDADPTEKYRLVNAHKRWKESVHKCNQRFAEIENWHSLKDLQQQLNYDKVEGSEMIWTPQAKFGYRSMIKDGPLELVKLNDSKKRIVKRKHVEVMLFSDIFIFAKSVKNKKSGKIELIVFKQAHRSLMDVDRLRNSGSTIDSKLEFIIEIKFLSKDKKAYASGQADAGTDIIYFKCKDHMMMERWLEAFNPPREEEDIYQAWECPQFEVIKDWNPPRKEEGDSMPLRKGEIIEVEKRGDNFMKGRLKDPEPFVSYNTSGYFPSTHVREIDSHRKKAREVKELAKQNMYNSLKTSL